MTGERDRERERERVDTSHLDGVEDGCGCAEVWEHLSEGRDGGTDDGTDTDDADADERSDEEPAADERGDLDTATGRGSTVVDAGGT